MGFSLKLKIDQSNEEAKSRLDRIYDILSNLGSAKQYMANRDYHNAIELFSRVLEVSITKFEKNNQVKLLYKYL